MGSWVRYPSPAARGPAVSCRPRLRRTGIPYHAAGNPAAGSPGHPPGTGHAPTTGNTDHSCARGPIPLPAFPWRAPTPPSPDSAEPTTPVRKVLRLQGAARAPSPPLPAGPSNSTARTPDGSPTGTADAGKTAWPAESPAGYDMGPSTRPHGTQSQKHHSPSPRAPPCRMEIPQKNNIKKSKKTTDNQNHPAPEPWARNPSPKPIPPTGRRAEKHAAPAPGWHMAPESEPCHNRVIENRMKGRVPCFR